jgi:hypothetical protein
MASTNTKKQLRARRIEAVYESICDERIEAIDARISDIASGFDCDLEEAIEEAAGKAIAEFDTLVREGYTADEIEAVLEHHNPGYFDHSGYRHLRDLWRRDWVPEREQAQAGSSPVQKGATA